MLSTVGVVIRGGRTSSSLIRRGTGTGTGGCRGGSRGSILRSRSLCGCLRLCVLGQLWHLTCVLIAPRLLRGRGGTVSIIGSLSAVTA